MIARKEMVPSCVGASSRVQLERNCGPDSCGASRRSLTSRATFPYLRGYLVNYTIKEDGTDLHFKCEEESYAGCFPIRLLLEMHRIDRLDHMFLEPAIVPH